MTEAATTFEFPPGYHRGEEIKEGARDAFIEDTKTFLEIAEKLAN